MLRRISWGLKLSALVVALLLFVPRFLVLSLPGSFDLSELAASLALVMLYLLLAPVFRRSPLSWQLVGGLAASVLVLLLAGLPPPAEPDEPAGEQDSRIQSEYSSEIPPDGAALEPAQVMGTIDSLARDGGAAIRNAGIFSGGGTLGTTLGALGDVTSTTAEILIRTVYSGSNVVREDSVIQGEPRESRPVQALPLLALIGAAMASMMVLVSLRYLVLIERSRSTLGRYRFMLTMIFLQVLYVTLGMEAMVRGAFAELDPRLGTLLSISVFYVLLIVAAVINGFRVKWIHYLNRGRKYLALAGVLLVLVLSRTVLTYFYSGRLTSESAAIGTFIGCVATVLLFYSTIAAVSILLHLPSARLVDRKLEQLRVLEGLGQSIFSTLDEQRIMAASVFLGRKITGADSCWAVRLDQQGFTMWEEAPPAADRSTGFPREWYAEVMLRLQSGKGTILLNSYPGTDLAAISSGDSAVPGSLMASLLRIRKDVLGMVFASSERQYAFMSESEGLFGTFAMQVTAGIENTRLFDSQLEQERYREELIIARSIQESLLPGELPPVDRFDIAGLSVPSSQVGGDYYDLFRLPDGLLGFAIADVAGKGTAAALLMASLESALHAIAPGTGKNASAVTSRLNALLSQRMPDDKFITFFYGVLDPSDGTISYCCAGHDPPVVFRLDGTMEHLDTGGLVLGVIDHAEYETGSVTLRPGDRLLLYTDGITETMDGEEDGTEFGVKGLERFLARHSGLPSRDILDMLLVTLAEYRKGKAPLDDMTLLLLGETGGLSDGSETH